MSRRAETTPASALVLFDIDGTLLRKAGPHHREALVLAIQREIGIETTTGGIPVQGMLDRDILRLMLQNAHVPDAEIADIMPRLVRRAQIIYQRLCPDLREKVCPGVRRVLYYIHRRQLPIGLVTGNLSRIAWKKMEHAGIRDYFRYGVFAEMAKTRAELARLAIEQARRKRWIAPDAAISLIGDHPNDVEAAKLSGIRSIAVATGLATTGELVSCQPDYLLPDLRHLRLSMLLCPNK